MWQDKLKEIIYILENSDVNEIDLNFWGRKYRVVKSPGVNVVEEKASSKPLNLYQSNQTDANQDTSIDSPVTNNSNEILSPMPGTFYVASSPEADPFVKVGDSIKKGETLCIIEAMKIMNEIEAEYNGVISEVLIKNGDPVEYNQPLFKITPS
jgi:acetyl-CoA carboxylase biotin carboxyl carrier protein